MFVRRIPYQSVRAAADPPLVAAAAARGGDRADRRGVRAAVLRRGGRGGRRGVGGAREVVILLDQSASMGYGDHWTRAQDEARTIVERPVGAKTARRSCCSAAAPRRTCARRRPRRGSSRRSTRPTVSSGATRYGPALKLAESLLSRSGLPRKEAFLISDFQKTGWERQEEIHLPEGATLTPISVATIERLEPRGAVGRDSSGRRSPARSA